MQPTFSFPKAWNLLLNFVYQEAASSFFPGLILLLLLLTRFVEIPGLPRYDFLLLCCIVIQIWMVWGLKVETVDELKTITLFHAIAMAMEIYKVNLGSWVYPGEAYTKLLGVPLFAGFMYAAVASYITQAWRRLHLRIENFPPSWVNWLFVLLIYGNFYTNAVFYDIRWLIIAGLFVAYWRTRIYFSLSTQPFKRPDPALAPVQAFWLPLKLAFLLVATFIWIAENIGTYLGAWQYPSQADGWQMVSVSKLTSWALLFIVSFVLVAQLKRIKAQRTGLEQF
ncbi:DUF817 domain-containing protein [Meiothermus sp.]|uniref:DUF817 domain-containing protein n=1 Tax=Meiothermus sp. TaxID=1955249 RepID=UPI0021DD5286|nr:DUF817 domain-containing protein [Meiothermus sp.]GIW35673.1 MAG: hypothetical protein KatS3mg072_3006 [Meiothermus sp.]